MKRRTKRKTGATARPSLKTLLRRSGLLHSAKRFMAERKNSSARKVLRELLAETPDHGEGNHLLALVEMREERLDAALTHLQRALTAKDVNRGDIFNTLANLHYRLGNPEKSLDNALEALALKPDDPGLLNKIAHTLQTLERYDEAATYHQRALAIDDRDADAWGDYGVTRSKQGRLQEGITLYEKALTIRGEDAGLLLNIGYNRLMQGKSREAVAIFARICDRNPHHHHALSNLLLCSHYERPGEWGEMTAVKKSLAAVFAPLEAIGRQRTFPAGDPDKPLRVGFVSGDFRQHPVAAFLEPLFAALRPDQFQAICYSHGHASDRITDRLQSSVRAWRDIATIDDDRAVRRILADGVDILVDLAGHTAGNRLKLFALKPAPLQVSWLGYPGTSALTTMDYQLTCAVADPDDDHEPGRTERLVRLPNGFHCFGVPATAPLPNPPPVREKGHVTFTSFNNPAKITGEVLETWAALMRAVPGSRLMLKGKAFDCPAARDRFLRILAHCGIADQRIDLFGWQRRNQDHFAFYHRADLALDPFPYNGVTTTCEALWMGLPVITLRGKHRVARMGASLLTQAGLESFIAEDKADYIHKAAALAGDVQRLTNLRHDLRSHLQRSPLCDADGFARQMDHTLRTLWRHRCQTIGQ